VAPIRVWQGRSSATAQDWPGFVSFARAALHTGLNVRTIAIINQKGGCGKTTSAINLAGVFARRGKRTLLVDLDPQSHCAAGLAIPEQRIDVQIGDAMTSATPNGKSVDWARLLWRVSRNLDLAPSTVRLAALEAPRGGLGGAEDAERRLDMVLTRLADQYDICLIDCPPSIGVLTFNALVAATEVLIPVETGFFALQGAAKQVQMIKAMGKKIGVQPAHRIVPTMYDETNPLAREVLEQINSRFKGLVAPVVIRLDAKLREAVNFGQPAIEYAPESAGAQDYVALADWLLRTPAMRKVSVSEEASDASEGTPVRTRAVAVESLLNGRAGAEEDVKAPRAEPEAPVVAGEGNRGGVVTAERTRTRVGVLELVETEGRKAWPSVESLRPVLGVRVTAQGVLFVQPASAGRVMAVAGNFNRWSAGATPMTLNADLGVFECVVKLPAGRHEYRLIVDESWNSDAFNPRVTTNPFGECNSYIDVPGEGVAFYA